MCRHLGYLGPPVPVSEPLLRGPNSLRTQAWAPREMRGGGTVNADGFGVAWWPRPGVVTGYRNPMPIWTDPAVEEVLGQLSATAVLAAVRSATVGMPIDRASCAPFVRGSWAFSHNGVVPNWHKTIGSVFRGGGLGGVDAATLLCLESATDSAALWLALAVRLDAADPSTALVGLVTDVLRAAPDARLNLLLGDGERLWATTCYHSLSVLATDDSVVVASEPYDDDPRWQPVPDRRLVVARPGELTIEPI